MGRHRRPVNAAGGLVALAAVAASIGFPGASHAATSGEVTPGQPEHEAVLDSSVRPATQAAGSPQTYTVKPGDFLSRIAGKLCANTSAWRNLASANKLRNPDLIFPGEELKVACHAAVSAVTSSPRATVDSHARAVVTSASGVFSCSALEDLWEEAGGSHGEAFMAAEIAKAESGGRSSAISPTDDFGLWQINGGHGRALATLDPLGNAKAAVLISGDGRNWNPWTTFRTGAYRGLC
jgi:LysM repeat protein